MSSIASPVTHTAEVAVNSAVTPPASRPAEVAAGTINSPQPIAMAPANPSTISWAGRRATRPSHRITDVGGRSPRRYPHNRAGETRSPQRPARRGALACGGLLNGAHTSSVTPAATTVKNPANVSSPNSS
ncbi:hypothetical protein Areg01_87600 [Actinoplanes regularis]|nr:hypothetical protein Areg01_87600 [Actinoplanes regularis]